jgi:hypothetical protein
MRRDRRSNLGQPVTAIAGFGRRHVISPHQLISGFYPDVSGG